MNSIFKSNSLSLFLVFFTPVFLAFFLEASAEGIMSYGILPNFFENVLFTVVIFLCAQQFITFYRYNFVIHILILSHYVALIVEVGLYLLFQIRMNAAYVHVVLNTNLEEASEFTNVYFQSRLFWLVLFVVPIGLFFSKQQKLSIRFDMKRTLKALIICLLIAGAFRFFHLGKWNLPFISTKSYFEYRAQIKAINEFKNKTINLEVETLSANKTVVVIVGESTGRQHMSLYGYKNKTTPKLEALSDSLLVYNDVISSNVYTTGSMYDILTLSNYEDPEQSIPLFSYLKAANYKVFWLSNQRAVGFNDNMISRLAALADESVFLSHNDFRNKTLYDAVLLDKLEEKLKVEEKKIIFLHLIGTHYDYSKRYPDTFSIFDTEHDTPKARIVATYDNAILYNDFIVSEVINKTKYKEKSAVLYFSDHGEEVFDKANYFGHFQNKPTVAMYEIPFLVYLSKDFESPKDFVIDVSRKYMLDDMPHSLMHLMGIKSELLKDSRSIFSAKFEDRKRMINKGLEFDDFKSK